MGMNYYVVSKTPSIIYKPIHIGKSSYGWLFLFHTTPYWHSYEELKEWLQQNVNKENSKLTIIDEEDNLVTYEELIAKIDTKQADPDSLKNPDNFLYCENINGYRFSSSEFC